MGPAATTAQLLDSLDQDLPQFLEGFDQLLQISQDETAALGAQAGGSGKGAEWMKEHPLIDGAAVVGIVGGIAGVAIYKARKAAQKKKQEIADYEQKKLDEAEQKEKVKYDEYLQAERARIDLYPEVYFRPTAAKEGDSEGILQDLLVVRFLARQAEEEIALLESDFNESVENDMSSEARRLTDKLSNSAEEKASEEVVQILHSEEQSLLKSAEITIKDKEQELVAEKIKGLESDAENSIESISSGSSDDML